MKFCKDCKHSKTIGSDDRYCIHPKISDRDLVEGEMPITILSTCANQRYCPDTALLDCGKEGKYFEQKKVEWFSKK